jgi:hypothetical protein
MTADTYGMEHLAAPKITATQLRQVLATRAGLLAQDMADGRTYAYPKGLTKAEAMDESLVVVLTHDEAASYLAEADGDHARAAKVAALVLAWEMEQIDRRLAATAKADEL